MSSSEPMVPLSEIKEVHSRMSEESRGNSEYTEYSIGVAFCADELLELIERYDTDSDREGPDA